MCTVAVLPTELLILILLDLDYLHVLRCRQASDLFVDAPLSSPLTPSASHPQVCKTFRELVDHDVRFQYKIELAAAGMEDGPPSALAPADRLAALRTRQAAWDTLSWSELSEHPMGIGSVWELYGGVLAQSESRRTLTFRQLPSKIRGIEQREWTIRDVGFDVRDFGMDPAQDLLIAIEQRWFG